MIFNERKKKMVFEDCRGSPVLQKICKNYGRCKILLITREHFFKFPALKQGSISSLKIFKVHFKVMLKVREIWKKIHNISPMYLTFCRIALLVIFPLSLRDFFHFTWCDWWDVTKARGVYILIYCWGHYPVQIMWNSAFHKFF